MVDPEAVHRPGLDELSHEAVGQLEDAFVLDSDTDEVVDVEEAPVVAGPAVPPPGEAVVLAGDDLRHVVAWLARAVGEGERRAVRPVAKDCGAVDDLDAELVGGEDILEGCPEYREDHLSRAAAGSLV